MSQDDGIPQSIAAGRRLLRAQIRLAFAVDRMQEWAKDKNAAFTAVISELNGHGQDYCDEVIGRLIDSHTMQMGVRTRSVLSAIQNVERAVTLIADAYPQNERGWALPLCYDTIEWVRAAGSIARSSPDAKDQIHNWFADFELLQEKVSLLIRAYGGAGSPIIESHTRESQTAPIVPPMPLLDTTDGLILRALAQANRAMVIVEIAAAVNRSDRTCKPRLRALRTAGLVERKGQRGGYAITQAGRDKFATLEANLPDDFT